MPQAILIAYTVLAALFVATVSVAEFRAARHLRARHVSWLTLAWALAGAAVGSIAILVLDAATRPPEDPAAGISAAASFSPIWFVLIPFATAAAAERAGWIVSYRRAFGGEPSPPRTR
jgi:hypothetical protein